LARTIAVGVMCVGLCALNQSAHESVLAERNHEIESRTARHRSASTMFVPEPRREARRERGGRSVGAAPQQSYGCPNSGLEEREEATSPSYCDAYYYCSFPQYACRLSARTGWFIERYFRVCPSCAPFSAAGATGIGAPLSSIVPNSSRIDLPPTLSRPGEAQDAGVDASLTSHALSRVSVSSAVVQAAGGSSIAPALSADGQFVAFDPSSPW
jgi:hypothetical protein